MPTGKRVDTRTREQIVTLLKRGVARKEVARAAGVGLTLVNKIAREIGH